MRIQLPVKVDNIIKTLEAAGYEAFAVGGCIRDSVLGRTPQDWDITTSAKPQDVKRLFSHTIDTGIQHGTVTVMLEHEGFEVTTYRIDGEYCIFLYFCLCHLLDILFFQAQIYKFPKNSV